MAMFLRFHSHPGSFSSSRITREVLGSILTDIVQSSCECWHLTRRGRRLISFKGSVKFVQTSCRVSVPGISPRNEGKTPSNILKDKKAVPYADPPSIKDVNLLHQFFDNSAKLMVLTGAGISTESGIPDYRSPNGAYSTGFRPITHQVI